MAMRKRNPLSFSYKDYLNDPDSSRMSYEQWKNKNEWEDTDKCENCGAYKGSELYCTKCDKY
ncbi:hypothetical protein [Peribacillus sp. TH24]|uniref:hypothetical protein n=1 Tax=Peribacillus sp. TH24 TaxID=2798483 RepID=UPI0019120A2B|nr:hypothetical protein [Peribacillus sp. TH24]MBK5446838.1 hypothetical protein [Peribacillus sp. TH24]